AYQAMDIKLPCEVRWGEQAAPVPTVSRARRYVDRQLHQSLAPRRREGSAATDRPGHGACRGAGWFQLLKTTSPCLAKSSQKPPSGSAASLSPLTPGRSCHCLEGRFIEGAGR